MADESFSMEVMDSLNKIHNNRFRVDPVLRDKRGSISQQRQHDSNDEDDAYPEETMKIIARRSSRLSSIKMSFRDADPSETRKSMQATRFQVSERNPSSDEEADEAQDLLDGIENNQDTKIYKSFRHFTREALPRLDNYRNILSIQAQNRPTLDELHNATLSQKDQERMQREMDMEAATGKSQYKMGWKQGVLMRCLLNIWGVMLFLRLTWVVGQAGIAQGLFLILTTTVVTTITSLSMSAISTNGQIKGGGTYFMISRSLGPEFGGSIGLIFSLANAVACAMYVVGFCESIGDLLKSFGTQIVDGATQDVRIIGCITLVILLGVVCVGMEWEAKAQFGLLVILLIAIGDFLLGTFIGPKSDEEVAKGFVGYNMSLLMTNMKADYRQESPEEPKHNFFSVFSIFFPAATGILAGANISGDLKDPQKAIPKGTLLAVVITTISYVVMAVLAGATVVREATGDVADMVNGSMAFLDCAGGDCKFGLLHSSQVVELVSAWGPLIYAGCFAATLSSALASLVSAPKVFQALCKDKLYPKIEWFARGYGKNNEPVRGYILTFFIAIAFILVGELNLIAPLISNFFLAAYALINFSTFHASLAKPLGWRPTFKYFNMWLSLIGALLCIFVMFLISWATALLTFGFVLALYLIVAYRKPDVNWGSSTQAQTYKSALNSVQQLNNVEDHIKNYRPQILVLSGSPNSRPILVDFAYSLTKNVSLLLCGHIIKGATNHKHQNYLQRKARDWFALHKLKAFYTHVDDDSFENGCKALMQASGIGKLKPNIVLMGYKNDWMTCDKEDLEMYFNVVHKAFDMYFSVGILRFGKGLDYSMILGDDVPKNNLDVPRSMMTTDSTADLKIHGSLESLSRNESQENGTRNESMESNNTLSPTKDNMANKASSTSDLSSVAGGPLLGPQVSMAPDSTANTSGIDKSLSVSNKKSSAKKEKDQPQEDLYRGPGGALLPQEIINELTTFSRKQSNAVIDVWWLYDDGGLTLLLPYIISTRRNFANCKLRVFALANKRAELEFEQRNMASLLSKFRIDYADLKLLPDITKKPKEETTKYFENLIKNFKCDNPDEEDAAGKITESELLSVQDKTNRYLRIREYLHEHSMESDLIVMTLPMPKKNIVCAALYMSWLESLSAGMPPFLFVRGNQSSVLTFYS